MAVKNKLIPSNPFQFVILPPLERHETKFYNEVQLKALFSALENDPMLLEKLLMDPEMSYMIEDYIAGVEWTSSPSAAPVPPVTVESAFAEGIPYG